MQLINAQAMIPRMKIQESMTEAKAWFYSRIRREVEETEGIGSEGFIGIRWKKSQVSRKIK